jgi:hypothetical protein
MPNFNFLFSFFLSFRCLAATPKLEPIASQLPAQDTSEQIPSLPAFTFTPFSPLSPSLASSDFQTTTIQPSR